MNAVVHAEEVMGTVVAFEVRGQPAGAPAAIEEAVAWLHWVDATFSTYRPDSEISRLDRGALTEDVCHPEVRHILALCERLRATTNGYFDARATGRLDPSGVVKGWSIERASQMLTAAGCPDHLIDGGGDVRLHGQAGPKIDWRVGVVHPLRLDAYCAALHLDHGAVATSGTYQRGYHVIDPHRRRPAADLAAVTVIGAELTMADAYATAALAMGTAAHVWLEGLPDHEAMVIDTDGRGWETTGFCRYRLDVADTGMLTSAGSSPSHVNDRG
jgi:thiamine biosynthesis lipoprotein